MSDTRQSRVTAEPGYTSGSTQATGWVGWIVFSGILMVMLGFFQGMMGLVALFNDTYYLVARSGLVVSVDYTTWGWVHLIVGCVAVAAGFGVLVGQMWARVFGIILAVLSATLNIAFLAAYPVWSAIIIAVDILIIYALSVHGREVKNTYDA
jgi:hypothetical protein